MPTDDDQPGDRPQDEFVAAVRPDPTQPPAATIELTGLLGDSDRPGHRRLYFTRDLDRYAEFRAEDVLAVADVPADQPPFVGLAATRVTLRREAPVELTRVRAARPVDEFDLDLRLGGSRPAGLMPVDDPFSFPFDENNCGGGTGTDFCPSGGVTCGATCDGSCGFSCVVTCNDTCGNKCRTENCPTNTCGTQCGTCNNTCANTCNTCWTKCNQGTCQTCATQCGGTCNNTCNTCETKCGTCNTCGTCNWHIPACGSF